MAPGIPTTPTARMGVYKRLADVPERHRLENYADAYADRDVWAEFRAAEYPPETTGERTREDVARAGRFLQEHADAHDVHPALATPVVVESFATWLLEDREYSPRMACAYFDRVDSFYEWLLWHADHPHAYNPARMAAADGGAAGRVWTWLYEHDGGRALDAVDADRTTDETTATPDPDQ